MQEKAAIGSDSRGGRSRALVWPLAIFSVLAIVFALALKTGDPSKLPSALIGKDAFQEIDINGITLPMTKHNYLVRDANDLPRVLAEAFHIARTGRPGPVHVDITKDALQQETSAPHPTHDEVVAGLPGFRPNLEANGRQLKLAAHHVACRHDFEQLQLQVLRM